MFIGMPSPTENGFVEHTFSLEIFKKSFAVTSLLKSSHVESWLDADLKDKWEFVALKQSCKMSWIFFFLLKNKDFAWYDNSQVLDLSHNSNIMLIYVYEFGHGHDQGSELGHGSTWF